MTEVVAERSHCQVTNSQIISPQAWRQMTPSLFPESIAELRCQERRSQAMRESGVISSWIDKTTQTCLADVPEPL
jgi:hypothetical protein